MNSLEILKVARLGYLDLGEYRIKTKPTRFAGWVGRKPACSYPHGAEHLQQQMAPAWEGQIT